jgi:serine/threonine-protein kinase
MPSVEERLEADPNIGRHIAGKYEVQSVIGRGAMGIVYQARQMALDKIVALKVLSHHLRDDEEFVSRFHTEARAASRLDHPNSTRVLDFGAEPDGLLYIAMELLDGRTLAQVIAEEWPIPTERIASIMSQTLSAVGAAHKLGILHRDLKSDNIMILDGRDEDDRRIDVVKVCDFGIAKLEGTADIQQSGKYDAAASPHRATRAGNIVGTPEYMSPEQASGNSAAVDARSDLYSLGCVLYEMLTRKTPFEGKYLAMILSQQVSDEPKPPSAIREGIDPRLEAICLRALRKKKEDRWRSAKEMRAEIKPLGQPVESPPVAIEPSGRKSIFDPTAPTLADSTTTVRPVPRSRARWLVPLFLLTTVIGAAVGWRWTHRSKVAASTSVASAEPTTTTTPSSSITTDLPAPTASTPEMKMHPVPTHVALPVARTAPTSSGDPVETATATMPPPSATATTTVAATAPPTATTAPPPAVIVDPSRGNVDIGRIVPDRINARDVESGLRHIDFTSCYRTALGQFKSPIAGTGTLEIEMDEERVLRATLTGGDFPSSMRQCVSSKAMTARISNVDTGSASAKVTLRFYFQ